ncbi:MAG: hydrogenase formation protein HypD, partial [Spirochaetota bacterium]
NKEIVKELTRSLAEVSSLIHPLTIMHVCGTHEHEIGKYGLRQLLPDNIKLIAGPGCPVCITPASVIATAIRIACNPDRPIFCTYGDMVRVPIATGSILDSRGKGADVRVVYSIREAISLAVEHPSRRVVFFSVGFETTAAPVASAIKTGLPDNFLLYCCHRYVPPAVRALTGIENGPGGYLLPGHASVITGTRAYDFLHEDHNLPSAVSGFEPVDILSAILSIVRQIRYNKPTVANCYPRVVRAEGNIKARAVMADVFETTDARWRGIGLLPGTGLELKTPYTRYSALSYYEIEEVPTDDIIKGCICHLVLTGKKIPEECSHFGIACTPFNPKGPCMVSNEGTCRAHYLYPEENRV